MSGSPLRKEGFRLQGIGFRLQASGFRLQEKRQAARCILFQEPEA
jgi:hypothetical protein